VGGVVLRRGLVGGCGWEVTEGVVLQVHGARAAVFPGGGARAASGAELSGVLRRQPRRREGVELAGSAGGGGGGVVVSSCSFERIWEGFV
jgi:hypothetical protein